MKIIDALVLASTKRKTRRIRMAAVTFVSALLFAVLFCGAFLAAGLSQSAAKFEDVGYNNRYLTMVTPSQDNEAYMRAQQKAEAEVEADLKSRKILIDDQTKRRSDVLFEMFRRAEIYRTAEAAEKNRLYREKVQQEFAPKNIFTMHSADKFMSSKLQTEKDQDPLLTKTKKEVDDPNAIKDGGFNPASDPSFVTAPGEMMQPHIQPGQSFAWKPGEPYPVVITYNYARQLTSRSFSGLTAGQTVQAHKDLIAELTGKEITYCYRNATAENTLTAVLEHNKNAPLDNNPATKVVPIKYCTDFDATELKKAGYIQEAPPTTYIDGSKFLYDYYKPAPAETRQLKMKVVGFVAAPEQVGADIANQFFGLINAWPSPLLIILPAEVRANDPFVKDAVKDNSPGGMGTTEVTFVELASREQQKAFIATSCKGDECFAGSRPTIMPFGSVKNALDDVIDQFITWAQWIVAAIGVVAAVMITLTVSKIMADSTKEIAVFRSLGARRFDIAQIYFAYGTMLAASSLAMAVIIAVGVALIISLLMTEQLQLLLVQAVGAYTTTEQASLFGIEPLWLLGLGGALLLAAMVGILLPIAFTVRRNVMTLMREE